MISFGPMIDVPSQADPDAPINALETASNDMIQKRENPMKNHIITLKKPIPPSPNHLSAEDLFNARRSFGLSLSEMGRMLGLKDSPYLRDHMFALENGKKKISPMMARLIKAYLAGYRPSDWPSAQNKSHNEMRTIKPRQDLC